MRLFSVLILGSIAALSTPARGAAPAAVTRVLRAIDFEERRLGNSEELPMHWKKLDGEGMPHYVNGRLDAGRAHSGQYSFRFDLNGGSLVYRYAPGKIRVQPGAHYRVECLVRTTVLPNARARLSAMLTDADGHVLSGTTRHSEPYAALREQDDWQRLSVELSADDPGQEAFLVIELGLLQPAMFTPTVLGDRAIFPQDIRGTAWFDDVSVCQVPRVELSTERPGNIFYRDDIPRLLIDVNDRSTDDLAAQLVIRDADGRTVYQRSGALDDSAAQTPSPGRKKVSLLLPELVPGWYEAALVMTSQGQSLGEQALDLVLLAEPREAIAPDGRFGIIATDLPFEGWSELPEILPVLGAGRVKLSVWSEAGDVQNVDPAAFDQLLERLGELGITPTACLSALPPELADKLGGDSSLVALSRAEKTDWQQKLSFLISRHANHLDRWQLGRDGTDAFVTQPAMREVYRKVYRQFSALMDSPDLAMPWPAWYEMDGELPATVALAVPPSVLPEQLPLYMQDLRGRQGHNLSLSLQPLDRRRYGRQRQLRDLAQRVVYALAADARRIDLPLPFAVKRKDDQIVKQPDEMLLVIRTLIATLGNAEFRGRVPIAEDVEAFLFERAGTGILVAWDRGGSAKVRRLQLNLGKRPMRIDLFGNAAALVRPLASHAGADAMAAGARGEKPPEGIEIEIGPMPIFLVDIDAQAAQLRASVAFDRPLIESSFQAHTRRLRFINPYATAIGGTVKLIPPAGWSLSPSVQTFTLNPGEKFDRELTIQFPYNNLAGPKAITAEFLVQGERNIAFTVPVMLNLGLSDVGMQTLALRDGNDVVVQQMITNYGDHPIDYTAFAIYPNQARQERLVTKLGPGHTTIKRYRFSGVSIAAGTAVRTGLKELVGTRILNDEVPIQ